MIKFLLEKEFKQMKRNPFIPRVIVFFPVMIMLILPMAATMEVKNINVTIVDSDHSTLSKRLTDKIGASDYFVLREVCDTYNEALQGVENGTSDVIVEIPNYFERDIMRGNMSQVLISANAVNGVKGGLGSSYMNSLITDFAADIGEQNAVIPSGSTARIDVKPYFKYNIFLDYRFYMVPALMVMLLTMICGFMPALNIVAEKETGTIEQINVSPVGKFTFIFTKVFPYWIIGFFVFSIGVIIARTVYGIVPNGSLLSIYVAATLYTIVVSGLGLVISNTSDTVQQAMFMMYFFVMIFIIMSGLFTPVNSMPEWAQKITLINPLRYFMDIMRSIFIRSSTLSELTKPLLALAAFAVVSNLWAVVSYRKRN